MAWFPASNSITPNSLAPVVTAVPSGAGGLDDVVVPPVSVVGAAVVVDGEGCSFAVSSTGASPPHAVATRATARAATADRAVRVLFAVTTDLRNRRETGGEVIVVGRAVVSMTPRGETTFKRGATGHRPPTGTGSCPD